MLDRVVDAAADLGGKVVDDSLRDFAECGDVSLELLARRVFALVDALGEIARRKALVVLLVGEVLALVEQAAHVVGQPARGLEVRGIAAIGAFAVELVGGGVDGVAELAVTRVLRALRAFEELHHRGGALRAVASAQLFGHAVEVLGLVRALREFLPAVLLVVETKLIDAATAGRIAGADDGDDALAHHELAVHFGAVGELPRAVGLTLDGADARYVDLGETLVVVGDGGAFRIVVVTVARVGLNLGDATVRVERARRALQVVVDLARAVPVETRGLERVGKREGVGLGIVIRVGRGRRDLAVGIARGEVEALLRFGIGNLLEVGILEILAVRATRHLLENGRALRSGAAHSDAENAVAGRVLLVVEAHARAVGVVHLYDAVVAVDVSTRAVFVRVPAPMHVNGHLVCAAVRPHDRAGLRFVILDLDGLVRELALNANQTVVIAVRGDARTIRERLDFRRQSGPARLRVRSGRYKRQHQEEKSSDKVRCNALRTPILRQQLIA